MPLGVTQPRAGARVNWADSLTRGLRRAFPMVEGAGSRITDLASGQHNFAATTGTVAPGWTAGKYGTASLHAGQGYWAPTGPPLNIPYVTFAVWVRLDSVAVTMQLANFANGPGSVTFDKRLTFSALSGGRFTAYTLENGGGFTSLPGVTVPVVGVWYHVALTNDGVTLRLYLNGVQDAEAAAGPSYTLYTVPNVCLAYGTGGAAPPLTGALGPCYVWDRALTVREIQRLAQDPYAVLVVPRRLAVPVAGATSGTALGQSAGHGQNAGNRTTSSASTGAAAASGQCAATRTTSGTSTGASAAGSQSVGGKGGQAALQGQSAAQGQTVGSSTPSITATFQGQSAAQGMAATAKAASGASSGHSAAQGAATGAKAASGTSTGQAASSGGAAGTKASQAPGRGTAVAHGQTAGVAGGPALIGSLQGQSAGHGTAATAKAASGTAQGQSAAHGASAAAKAARAAPTGQSAGHAQSVALAARRASLVGAGAAHGQAVLHVTVPARVTIQPSGGQVSGGFSGGQVTILPGGSGSTGGTA